MKVAETLSLPLSPDAVCAMYADPRYAEVRAEALGATSARSNVSGEPAGAFTVTTTLVMPTKGIPDVARPFVGSSVTITEEQSWQAPGADGSRAGSTRLVVEGTPASMTGTMRLEAVGADGARITVDGDMVAKVPLIGGRLERAAAPYVGKILRREEKAAAAYAKRFPAEG